jgi:hypothetical protein
MRGGIELLNLDMGLSMVLDFWKTHCYDSSGARLQSLFVSADADHSGDLDFSEYQNIIAKLKSGGLSADLAPRQMLRLYAQMSVGRERVDASVFVSVAQMFGLGKIPVGGRGVVVRGSGVQKKQLTERAVVFKLLETRWLELERRLGPLMNALRQTSQGHVIEELVQLLRSLVHEQEQPEHAVHCYHCIVGELPPAVGALELARAQDARRDAKHGKSSGEKVAKRGKSSRGRELRRTWEDTIERERERERD